ncbi:MAG TPA: SRPBCC family protein [Firmicutes bacterium]|nr:SRPBCC family protein [Bacillota bacterium]
MTVSNIKTLLPGDIQKVWGLVTAVADYPRWRSDLGKTEILNEKQFRDYTKKGYATTFTVTACEPHRRWEFTMDNGNMQGRWVGVFTPRGKQTEIDFTEEVAAKKLFLKPFVKAYLQRQQAQFVADLEKALLP